MKNDKYVKNLIRWSCALFLIDMFLYLLLGQMFSGIKLVVLLIIINTLLVYITGLVHNIIRK